MSSLFRVLGIDYDQWLALTRVALKMDMRVSRLGGAVSAQTKRGAALVGMSAFYLMTGCFAAVLVGLVRDVTLSGTLVLTYLMFMVGAMILMEHNAVITSPDDYVVLGFRPISSRTYFAVKLTNVFVYTMALTTAFGIIPMAAFGFAHGVRVGLAAVAAFYLSTTFTTLVLVFAYAWMLRAIGADRLGRAMGYVQLVMGFVVYGGYFAMSPLGDRSALAEWKLSASPLLFLYPATWFASYLSMAAGRLEMATVLPAVGSIIAIAGLAATLGGRLSLQYSEQLGALTAATSVRRSKPVSRRPPVWFRTGEARAMALLVRAQFRNDQKFRLSILSVLPLTVLYVFMSMRHGPLPDPFAMEWKRAPDVMLITLAILAFPTTLRLSLSRSDSHKASWIYFALPVERSRLVRAAKNIVVVFFLLPYLLFVAAFLTYFIGHPIHVLVHMAFLGLISHLFLQAVMLADPALPFSLPMQKGTRSGVMFITMSAAMGAGFVLVPMLSIFVYVSPVRIAVVATVLLSASLALDWMTRVRVDRMAESLEFGG